MAERDESERTVVKTYVPRYQKEIWREHAERVEMSQSEFVRAMVQAGRRGFDGEEGDSSGSNPRGDALESRIEAALREDPHQGWDQLRETLVADFEDRLEERLRDLQEQNRIEHSGRHGGYALTADE